MKESKAATSGLIKQVAAKGLYIAAGTVEVAPSHAHFLESVTNLKKIYASHLALSSQYNKAVEKHEEFVNKLTQPGLSDEEQDKLVIRKVCPG